jgi:hypothetical protein
MSFIEWGSYAIRDWISSFTKYTRFILLVESRDRIYWRGLFHDKRRNLTIYEKHQVDFIGKEW